MKYSDGVEKEVKEKLTPEQLEQYVAEKKNYQKLLEHKHLIMMVY